MTAARTHAGMHDDTRVSDSDLASLHLLHEMLALLSDPAAATIRIVPLCDQLPALTQRLVALARGRGYVRGPIDARRALAVIGNQGLEEVLLGYLEDLTVLKAERDEQRARAAR